MKIPDAILTFKLFDGAQVTDDKLKLALSVSSNLNFEEIKSALRSLFVSHPINPKHDDIHIKQEEAFHNKKYDQYDEKNKVHSSYQKPNNKLNPPFHRDQVRCIVCDSKVHRVNNCPQITQSVPLDETHLVTVRGLIHQKVSTKKRERGELN